MGYPTHYCVLCKREHDAAFWYHRMADGTKTYACGGKYNELTIEERSIWLHPDS